MPSKQSSAAKDKAAILRRKLVNNEINPIVDLFLSLVILILSPIIALSAFAHDRLMYNFLNKTYIYNVSWEVSVHPKSAFLS
jgi:hypothetical protein